MYRSCIIVVSVLSVLIVAGGCARKTNISALDPDISSIPGHSSSLDETAQGVQTEQGGEARTTTLYTPDGRSLETVYFEYDSYTLKSEARRSLEVNAGWLQENPGVNVTIEGHCDERGSDEYNLALGERRAKAVKSYLVALGVATERLSTISYGEEVPASIGRDEVAWGKNRRAEFK